MRRRATACVMLAALAVALLALMQFPIAAHAQDPPDTRAPEAQKQGTSVGAELAKESREAAGEDENAAFKQSSSVKLLARITGLSLRQAYWLAVLLNFFVIAAFFVWASRKHLPVAFRNRTASIQQAMQEASKASAEANRRLAEVESRLARLDAEIAALRASAEQESAAEEQRIRQAAEEDTRKVVEAAEQEIAAAAKNARRQLTAYAADLAVSLAQKQIEVDPATDQALVRSFAGQLVDGGSGKGEN